GRTLGDQDELRGAPEPSDPSRRCFQLRQPRGGQRKVPPAPPPPVECGGDLPCPRRSPRLARSPRRLGRAGSLCSDQPLPVAAPRRRHLRAGRPRLLREVLQLPKRHTNPLPRRLPPPRRLARFPQRHLVQSHVPTWHGKVLAL